jgi:hypothetical protein
LILFLCQHVRNPTRDKNILDLVITTDPGMVENVEIKEHLGNGDHNIITWNLICNVCINTNKQPYRKYYKADYDKMRKWFSDLNWNEEFKNLKLNEKWERFCSLIKVAISKYVPLGYNASKKCPKWMNRKAKSARNCKSKLWIKYRQSKSYNDLVEYKRAQNKAVKEYRKAKKQFEKKMAKDIKCNPKSFYSYVRSKSRVKEVVGPLKNRDGNVVSDNAEMCRILNDYFGTVFTDEKDITNMPEVKCKFTEAEN